MSAATDKDRELLGAIEDGLPLTPEPYADVASRIGTSEGDVISRLKRLLAQGVIKRLGLIVRHRALGYSANAMAVWSVPDEDVDRVAEQFVRHSFVTLCYRRPRRLPDWPYNLFCMVHGRSRRTVLEQIARLNETAGTGELESAVLFSKRCFKQRGARFSTSGRGEAA